MWVLVVEFWGDMERDKCCQSYVSLYGCGFHSNDDKNVECYYAIKLCFNSLIIGVTI